MKYILYKFKLCLEIELNYKNLNKNTSEYLFNSYEVHMKTKLNIEYEWNVKKARQ